MTDHVKMLEENKQLKAALDKINLIRNSIVGLQTINWSEHIYPLVAALDEAGCVVGMSYPENRKNFGTMLERTNTAEALLDELDKLHQPVECDHGVTQPTCEPICSCGAGWPCREHLIIHGKRE